MITFYLNGETKEYRGSTEESLLDYLRNTAGITTVKSGCAPQAACGACTVLIDGKARNSCSLPMKKIAGKSVVTQEGLSEYKKRVFTRAFVEKSGIQCGFCTPGIVMRASAFLEENNHPSRKEIEKMLKPHLCRCTGYTKIIDSLLYAAEAFRETKEIPEPVLKGKVGKRHPKYGAEKAVLGLSPYTADIQLDNMCYAALRFSDYPRAEILSIDTQDASQLEGVIQIITADDIPGDRLTGLIVKDWLMMLKAGEETKYIGDVIAIVIAETEREARAASDAVQIEYKELEPLTDPFEALKDSAPRLHKKGNLLSETLIKRGNMEKALSEAAFLSQGTYRTQRIEHAYLEPECAVARPGKNGGIEVLSQGQGVYEDRKQIAAILDLPPESVRVIQVPNGGGFGGKEDLSVQHHAALAAYLVNRPVKLTLNRDESIRMHPKRHPLVMEYTLACDREGMLTALKADIIGDTGAYASVGMKVLERAAGHATGAYSIPNADIRSRAVYTNNVPCGAMRGFGVNQVTFAVESCIDELCQMGGFDRWEFRYKNAITEGSVTATGQTIKGGAGVRNALEAVKGIFYSRKYAGLACGIKNTGIGNGMPDDGTVKIDVISEDEVILYHGWTEMGQGVNTMAVQFLCNETGIDPSVVRVKVDTSSETPSGMTTASRATSIIGNSIIETARPLKEDLETHTLAQLQGKSYTGSWRCDWTTKPGADSGDIVTHYSYSYAAQVVLLDDDGSIEKITAAHDAGKIINPNLFEGQIEGAVCMGLGYALSEELPMEKGKIINSRLNTMGLLKAADMPEVEVIGVEVADPHGPKGAKGVGEIGLVPTAAAVANAFSQYDKQRYYTLPIKKRNRAK